jgi:hypothetical protein
MRTMEKEGFKKAGHEVNFKPQHSVKQKVKAAYEWDAKFAQPVQKKEIVKEMTDEERLKRGTFVTNNPRKGAVGKGTHFGNYDHVVDGKVDNYDAKKLLARQ